MRSPSTLVCLANQQREDELHIRFACLRAQQRVMFKIHLDRLYPATAENIGKLMKVTLAGYNLDTGIINLVKDIIQQYQNDPQFTDELKGLLEELSRESFTPESLSAAYARISRSEKDVAALRREARSSVVRARRSNEKIIFGLGHASVAEHAMFNLDITDISRLALEELESHRLASYTESSQRYISMSGDFIIPPEICDLGFENGFTTVCRKLFEGYGELADKMEALYEELPDRERRIKALEDARYVLPLACRGQVGMTINARTAEQMIKNFLESKLEEVRRMGQQMLNTLRKVVPSLIKYTEPNEEIAESRELLRLFTNNINENTEDQLDVELISYPSAAEDFVLTAMMFTSGNSSFERMKKEVESLPESKKNELFIEAHRYLGMHDSVRRELELGYFTFSVTLSSSAFAQLKRHRIATLVKQCYSPELGVTVPQSVINCGAEDIFERCVELSDSTYEKINELSSGEVLPAASYILTNAHRRRIIFQANARELTHFSRLREDEHAQWDIRNIAGEMIARVKEVCPNLFMFCAGKDGFDALAEELFNA